MKVTEMFENDLCATATATATGEQIHHQRVVHW